MLVWLLETLLDVGDKQNDPFVYFGVKDDAHLLPVDYPCEYLLVSQKYLTILSDFLFALLSSTSNLLLLLSILRALLVVLSP